MTGTITQFNGLTEIEPESLEVLEYRQHTESSGYRFSTG